jgi:hypothetical protein
MRKSFQCAESEVASAARILSKSGLPVDMAVPFDFYMWGG